MSLERITNSSVQWRAPVDLQPQTERQKSHERRQPVSSPAYVVNLSPELRLNSNSAIDLTEGAVSPGTESEGTGAVNPQECQTCKNRKYVDRSNDPTVSFQSPTRLSPGAAETAVRAHEQEHVSNEQERADEQGRKVVAQTVAIHYAVCPECGRSFVAGGTTTTVTKAEVKPGASDTQTPGPSPGKGVDLRV